MALSMLRQKHGVPNEIDQLILHHFQKRSFRCYGVLCTNQCHVEVSLLTTLEEDYKANPKPVCLTCAPQCNPTWVGLAHYSRYLDAERQRVIGVTLNRVYGFMRPTNPWEPFLGPPAPLPPLQPLPELDFASLYPNAVATPQALRAHFVREERERERKEKRGHYDKRNGRKK